MKKLLLLLAFVVVLTANGQTLYSDNFTSFTVGNIGTDIAGTAVGQGNHKTFIGTGGTNAGNSSFAIVANSNPVYGNVLQITGSDAATGTRFMWKDGFPALWSARTAGNNIIEVEYDYFTGPASTSRNDFRIVVYSAEATPKIIAGMIFNKNATVSAVNYVNLCRGLAFFDNAGTMGLFSFGLGSTATPQIVFADNTWVKVGFSYNKTSGVVTWKGPGINGFVQGAAPGLDINEVDFLGAAGATNVVATVGVFDNIIVRASSTDTLLSVSSPEIISNKFSVSPNPTNDFINISSSDNIGVNGVTIADLNGRVIKEMSYNNISNIQVNLTDLADGMYIMNIKSEQGIATKKILKN